MAFGLPKASEITAMLDERFNKLLQAIEAMHATLREVLEELRRGEPR